MIDNRTKTYHKIKDKFGEIFWVRVINYYTNHIRQVANVISKRTIANPHWLMDYKLHRGTARLMNPVDLMVKHNFVSSKLIARDGFCYMNSAGGILPKDTAIEILEEIESDTFPYITISASISKWKNGKHYYVNGHGIRLENKPYYKEKFDSVKEAKQFLMKYVKEENIKVDEVQMYVTIGD